MTTNAAAMAKPEYAEVPLTAIAPSPTNPRKYFDQVLLDELAASVKEKGVLEPLLVRRIQGAKAKGRLFEIIAGERRWKAADMAKLETVPVIVRVMTDEEVLDTQIIENLQRADLHPLDEAQGYAHLLKAVPGLTVEELARRVAKTESYITRRLQLNRLIPAAQDDFRKGLLQAGHALELCRLTADVQKAAHVACFDSEWKGNANKRTPMRDRPRTVGHLQNWIQENLLLDLGKAPFKLDDAGLVPKAGACLTCPKRTGCSPALFDDIKKGDLCSDPICYQSKVQATVEFRTAEVIASTKQKTVPLICLDQYARDLPKGVLRANDYSPIFALVNTKTRCDHAVEAVVSYGPHLGETRVICTNPKCKDHLGRTGSIPRSSSSGERQEKSPAERRKFNERKQELFDCRVAEPVRRRTLKSIMAVVGTFKVKWPVDRSYFELMAWEHFVRVPGDTQNVMYEVLGWDELVKKDRTTSYSYSSDKEKKALPKIPKMTDTELLCFQVLCAIAHHGENFNLIGTRDQSVIIKLAEKHAVNYKLFDAEERVKQAAKKYKWDAERYLADIQAGKLKSEMPEVWESPAQIKRRAKGKPSLAAKAPAKASTKKPAARKPATRKPKKATKKR